MIEEKKCFKCGETKPVSEFYKHSKMADGYLGKCKACTKGDVSKHREKNLDRVKEYDRSRALLPHRVKARERYAKTEHGSERTAAAKKAWIGRNPEKRAAHMEVYKALQRGDLVKQPCQVCKSKRVHAHHADYSKPLEVDWLCSKHHREHHK